MNEKILQSLAKSLGAMIPPEIFDRFKIFLDNLNGKVETIEQRLKNIEDKQDRILELLSHTPQSEPLLGIEHDTSETSAANGDGRISSDDASGVYRISAEGV